jgi:hypothetical protein
MNKKTYQTPALHSVVLQQQQHLLAESGGEHASTRPTANFMSNPTIDGEE